MILSSKLIRSALALALALTLSPPVSANEEFGKVYLRGSRGMKSGDLNGAINAFSEAIGVNGQNGLAYLCRGECYYRQNNFSEAKKDFSRSIEISPNSSRAYIWRGTVNGRTGDEAASVEDYKKAIELNRHLAVNYFKSQGENNSAGANNTQANHNNDDCVRFYKEAMNALYPNGFTEDPSTITSYNEPLQEPSIVNEIKASNDSNVIRRNPGGIFPGADEYHGPDIKASLASLNEQIRGDSTNSAYYYQRAKVYQKMMRPTDSFRDYDTAISLEPNRAQFYVGKASLFYQLGKPMQVESTIQKARSVDPTVPKEIKFAVQPYPANFKWSGSEN
jgi:tetratricopeptide (TPR) repeat protein